MEGKSGDSSGGPAHPGRIAWATRFRDASETARREGRPLFIDFFDPG